MADDWQGFNPYEGTSASMDLDHPLDAVESPERLVHLDLKGAPPKLSYLEKITPLLKGWGATGFLMEYEDMFPFSGDLKCLACPQAYSIEEIQKLQSMAVAHDMKIIPLIQTFGHFEYVLKHQKFMHLRELPQFPMVLCPMKAGSLPLICQMVDQILNLHPQATHIHIGADEVYHLGLCQECQRSMVEQGLSDAMELFFSHIRNVLSYIKTSYPDITAIMWDDMFRTTDVQMLRASGLPSLVEPMVWFYDRVVKLPDGMWDRYSKVFDNIWVASAFKGATGPCMFATDIGYHIENHKSWLEVVREVAPKFGNFNGFCLTGWQRYDHYAVLCELLPVGLPSLAINLLIFSKGAFTARIHKQASDDLKFTSLMSCNSPHHMSTAIPECDFPGSKIFTGVQHLIFLKHEYRIFKANERMNGWMTYHHCKNNFTNPAHLIHFLPEAETLYAKLQEWKEEMITSLLEVFTKETVEEFLEIVINHKLIKLKNIIEAAQEQLLFKHQPYRYSQFKSPPSGV